MSPDILPNATASTEQIDLVHTVTYAVTETKDGDVETGAVLLDGRPVGRLSRRRRPSGVARRGEGSPDDDSVWHADAVGWRPHDGRPWDTRITSTAPTRLRAAEDLLRAYRNHR